MTANQFRGGLPTRSCLNQSLLIEDNCHPCLAAAIQGLSPSSFPFVCGFLRECGSLVAAQE